MVEEKNILASIACGNTLAFSAFFKFYSNKIYGYALSILQSEDAAEEILQNVFIKIWLRRDQLEKVDNFGGFLRVLARNETLNALKQITTTKNFTVQLVLSYRSLRQLSTT